VGDFSGARKLVWGRRFVPALAGVVVAGTLAVSAASAQSPVALSASVPPRQSAPAVLGAAPALPAPGLARFLVGSPVASARAPGVTPRIPARPSSSFAPPPGVRAAALGQGDITTYAGTETPGEGGAGTAAALLFENDGYEPDEDGIAVDGSGDVYFAAQNEIRKLSSAGVITTVAGNGYTGYSGDGGPALKAEIGNGVSGGGFGTGGQGALDDGLAVDSHGDLFIADTANNVVREVTSAGVISTYAGDGTQGYSGDTGAATAAELNEPADVAVDSSGNLYIADAGNSVIRKVSSGGTITTYAGNGTYGDSGIPGPATSAELAAPDGVATDSSGDLFIADAGNDLVDKVVPAGTISVVAGGGSGGLGGLATSASITPEDVKVDGSGDLFIPDGRGVLEVSASTQDINRISGGGTYNNFAGVNPVLPNGVTALGAYTVPQSIAVDGAGDVYGTDAYSTITKVSGGLLYTVAGDGFLNYSGDGGAATHANIDSLGQVAVDAVGNVLIADTYNERIRDVSVATGTMSTLAGFGEPDPNDVYASGAPANQTNLGQTTGVATTAQGVTYLSDYQQECIDEVSASGGIYTCVAGNSHAGFSGDNGPATAAEIKQPAGITVDTLGNLYIADQGNCRVRMVNPAGTITTVAGDGNCNASVTSGPATSAGVDPSDVAVDAAGNLFIADSSNDVIWKVTGGTISIFAGQLQTSGFSGDGGPATSAELNSPGAVTVDSAGNVFIGDGDNLRVREVTGGNINTVAGDGGLVDSGDGGSATAAGIGFPNGLAIDAHGDVFIGEYPYTENGTHVREVAGIAAAGLMGDADAAPIGGAPSVAELIGSPSQTCIPCQLNAVKGVHTSDPVDPETGNFGHTFTDLATPGFGVPLAFTRTYNSSAASTNSPFGWGWSFSYGASLNTSTGVLTEEGGSQIGFNLSTGAALAPRTEAMLEPNDPTTGEYTVLREDSPFEQLVFNSSGQLISEEDYTSYETAGTGATTLAYSGGKLSTITDPEGRHYTVTWTGNDITGLSDTSSPARTLTYSYDANGNLTKVVDVAGNVTEFAYNTSHQMVTMALPRFGGGTLPGAMSSCTATPPQGVISNVYAAGGQVACQADQLGRKTTFSYTSMNFTTMTGTVLITDPKSNETLDTFTNGEMTAQTKGYTSSVAATTQFIYDPGTFGIVQVIDPDGHASETYYDQYGNEVSSTDALGRTTTMTYQFPALPLTVTDPIGVATTNTYNTNGTLSTTSRPLLNAAGQIIATQESQYFYANTTFPEAITSMIDPGTNTWTYAYDADGDRTSITAPATPENSSGDQTLYGYNTTKGWLTSEVSPRGVVGGTLVTCTPPALGCTTYAHDGYGNLTVTTDPLGHTTSTTYDADQNVATTTDASANVTSYAYDLADERTSVTAPNGTVTQTVYNADGTVASTTDALGASTSYAYDAQARLISVTDPLSRVTSYGYDPAGNTVTTTDPGGTCPTWPITYPPTLSHTAACTVFQYDAADELTNRYYSDGVTPNVGPITYDLDGRRLTMPDGTGTGTKTWTWAYDSLGRVTSVTDDQSNTVSYGYDLRNDTTSITYPGTTGTVQRGFDAAGRLDQITDPASNVTTFGYDQDSDPTTATLPSTTGIVDTTSYDNADNLSGITDKQSSTTFASFAYGRTAANEVNSVTSTGVPSDNHSWAYTPDEQLASTDTSLYGYDGANNLTTTLTGTSQYFDTADELASTVAGPGIVLVGTSTAANSTGTTLAVTYPAGEKSGDELVLAATFAYPNTLTTPTGWAVAATKSSGTTSGTSDTTEVLSHAVTTDTSVTLTFSAAFARSVVVGDYRGVNTTSPVDVSGTVSGSAVTSITLPSVTTTKAGDRLVALTGANATANGTWTPAPSLTRRAAAGAADPVVALADRGVPAAGATGTTAAKYSTSAQLAGIEVALKPATTQPAATTYAYDTRGDRTTVTPHSGNATTLTYDQARRLASYTQGSTSDTYTYSGDGLRMTKTGTAAATFTWDTTTSTPLVLADGTNSYIYGPDGLPVEQIGTGGTISWYHHDQLGTTRVLTSSTGAVVGTFTYDAYGNQTAKTGTITSPLGYAAGYTDTESGLVYLTNRYYDSATGQFLTRDPLDAITGSAYGYADDTPLNGRDPNGLSCLQPGDSGPTSSVLVGCTGSNVFDSGELQNVHLIKSLATEPGIQPTWVVAPGSVTQIPDYADGTWIGGDWTENITFETKVTRVQCGSNWEYVERQLRIEQFRYTVSLPDEAGSPSGWRDILTPKFTRTYTKQLSEAVGYLPDAPWPEMTPTPS
jgi:RHS repeat-associated protein